MVPTLEDYETVNEAAARLDALPRLIQRWCKEGKLPCIKFGRDWFIERGAEPSVRRRVLKAKLREEK